MQTQALTQYLNTFFEVEKFKDYCPNGLQVEGKKETKKIVTAVTASLNIIEKTALAKADTLLVHHGFFWKNEPRIITENRKKRLFALLKHNINLIAYHLPLDAHPVVGNNVTLAKKLDIQPTNIALANEPPLLTGTIKEPKNIEALGKLIELKLKRKPTLIQANNHNIQTIAICTGAGQGLIEKIKALKVDAYLSGEISEATYHIAKENNIHYISAGHHATERYGIQALGDHLSKKFNLEISFIDENNPA